MNKGCLVIWRHALACLVLVAGLFGSSGSAVAQSISGTVLNQSAWANNQALLPPQWYVAPEAGTVVAGHGRVMVALFDLNDLELRLDVLPLAPADLINLVDLSTIVGNSWSYTLGAQLAAGTFRILAWVDGNDNGIHDVGEPHGYADVRISGSSSVNNIKVTIREDTDSDGLEDWWEVRWFGNLSQNGNMDYDNDGLSNADEYALIHAGVYVRPDHWDTDLDGMDDAWEVFYGLDPVSAIGDDGANGDPDSDGISNIDEYLGPDGIGWRADYNRDGIAEFTTSRDAMNPRDADSDRDGVPDGQEFLLDLTYPTHPMSSTNFMPRSLRMNVDSGAGAVIPDPAGNTFAFRTGGGTVEFWIYPETDGDGIIYSFPSAVAGQSHFRIALENFRPKLELLSGTNVTASVGGVGPSGSIQQLAPGKWTHLAFVIAPANNSISIHVDGVLLIAQKLFINPDFTGAPTICRGFADGYLDELRVWNYPRSVGDIETWSGRYYPAPGYVQQQAETRSGRVVQMYEYSNPHPLLMYFRFDEGGDAIENFAFMNHGLYPYAGSYRLTGPVVTSVTADQAASIAGSDDADGDELPEWWVELHNLEQYREYYTSAYGPEPVFCPDIPSAIEGFKYYRAFVAYGSVGANVGWLEDDGTVFHMPKSRPDFYEGEFSSYTRYVYLFVQPRSCPIRVYTPGMLETIVYVNGIRVTSVDDETSTGQRYDIAQYMSIGRNKIHIECKSKMAKANYSASGGAIASVPYTVRDYQAYSSALRPDPYGCNESPYQFDVAIGKFDAELLVNGVPQIVRGDQTRADPRSVWHVQTWSALYARDQFVPLPDREYRSVRTNPDYGVPLHAERDNNPLDPDAADDFLDAVYEYICGTNPRDRDSDNNGITDGDQDFDVDGLSNREEQRYGSNPWLADSDDDGIIDGLDVGDGHPAQSLSPQRNQSLRFGGGSNDFISLPLQQRFALDKWSVEAWVQPDADETDGGIIALRSVGGTASNYEVGLNGSNVPYVRYISIGGDVVQLTGVVPVPANGSSWTHIAATYYDRRLNLFVNGTNIASVTGGAFPALYAGGPVVQQIGTGFKGCIDEWRLWKTDLKAVDIQTRRDEVLTGLEEHLVAYYRFDDGTSATNRIGLLHVGTSRAPGWSWGQVEDNMLKFGADWQARWKNAASLVGEVSFSTNHIIQGPPRLLVYIESDLAIAAGALWSHNGGAAWNQSGYLETHLAAGEYNISFKTIGGWISPLTIPLTLERGQSYTVTGTYVQTASLMVIVDNAANIQAAAKWTIDGGTTLLGSGMQAGNLVPGSPGYNILFSDISDTVPGWQRPATMNVQLLEGEVRTVSASYTPIKGSLQISFTPTNVPSSARWRVSGNTNWFGSSEVVTNLAYGSHQVDYNTVDWWKAPASETIQISGSQVHTLSREWEKLPEPSAITVRITPDDAVSGGAQWGLNGTWYNSGQSVIVMPGEYLVTYRDLAGWMTPRDVRVVASSSATQVTGSYYRVSIAGSSENGGFRMPWGVAATPQLIYVSDFGNHRVQVLDRVSGRWIVLGGPGTGTGQFNQPMGLAVAANGDLWVADAGNHRIQRLSIASGVWTAFGSHGSKTGQFIAPYDLDVDSTGNVYVADYHNSRVQRRAANGAWSVIIQGGTQDGRVRYPSGIAVDAVGQLYVSDYDPSGEGFPGRVQKFLAGGTFLERIGTSEPDSGSLNQNMGLDVMPDGTLLVANTFDDEVLSRSMSAAWSALLAGGIVQRPRDVAADAWGNIIVTDGGNNRIVMLPATDSDADGLPDSMELLLGTNPLDPDSDGDGLSDGDEVRMGSSPLDAGSMAIVKMSPSDGVTLTSKRPAFEWPAVPFATWYQVWINRNGQNYLRQWVQGTNTWTPSQDLPSGTYQWWVQPWGPLTGSGAWTATADFNIPLLVPGLLVQIAPVGVQTESTLVYQWQKDAKATWYHVWVGRAGGGTFHDRWYAMTGTGVASVVIGGHVQGNYNWWIAGWSPDGSGPWTGPMAFSAPSVAAAKPVPVYPIGPILTAQPNFQWQIAPRAEWYRVYVTSSSGVVMDRWTQNVSFMSPVLLTSGVHSWWVGAWNKLSNTTVWSDRVEFSVP